MMPSRFLGDELLIWPNLPPYCRPSPLPLPLIPFGERTEALRIDIKHVRAHARRRAHTHASDAVPWHILPRSDLQSSQ